MDERTYKLFRYHEEALESFKSPATALWATNKLPAGLERRTKPRVKTS